MHYVPESARDFLPSAPDDEAELKPVGFHAQAAPIYLLTFAVALLLGADLLTGLVNDPAYSRWQTVLGFRLALLAAVLGGARILYQTLENLFEGRTGADLALTIATLAAIVLGEHTTAALVVLVALVGESIEGYTLSRARQAISQVFELRPATARLLREEQETEIPADGLEPGDRVLVRAGERIPVDGYVVGGHSSVDESALTGESVPRDTEPGDLVFAGTLNQFGGLTIETVRRGSQTTVARIVRLVAEAASRKTPLERTADRLARLFLPVVLGAAGLTLIGWRLYSGDWSDGWRPALAVLVVACPCPLILATPTAVMAAMARLARSGVIVKGSAALERLAAVDTVAFDKTGTLTRGEIAVTGVHSFGDLPETELLRMAGIAERHSEHLLARAIGRAAEQQGLVLPPPPEFTAHPGAGVVAQVPETVCGPAVLELVSPLLERRSDETVREAPAEEAQATCRVIVGNQRFLEQQGIPLAAEQLARLEELLAAGQTVLLVAIDNVLAGVIAASDQPRADCLSTVTELRASGIERFAILTGDQPAPARAIARQASLSDDVQAGLLPEDKAAWIRQQQAEGHLVAMIGDGVNDAPALAAATAGIALGGTGSDLAAEAGDLILMGDPLRPLPLLLRMSREMVANIRQSILLFAFGVNGLGMLLSAGGYLSPVAGAVFHEAASLAVMLNAMRLLWFERWDEAFLGRATGRLLQETERLTVALSPTRLVYRAMTHWSVLLRLTLTTAAGLWLLSGIVQIEEDEQALVTRFGRYREELEPGLHFRWPAPFERVVRERTQRVRSVQIGFRSRDSRTDEATADPATADSDVLQTGAPFELSVIEWTSEHADDSYQPFAAEALVMTGEEVPVELTADVQYRISSLYDFRFGSRDPEAVVRAAAESSIRQVAAGTALEHLLTDRRSEVEQRCRQLITDRISRYGLGVEIEQVYLLDVHPPRPVVAAYREVADAQEERQQRINEAVAWRTSRLLSAVGEPVLGQLEQEEATRIRAAAGRANSPEPEAMGDVDFSLAVAPDWQLTPELWRKLSVEAAEPDEEHRPRLSGETAAQLAAALQQATEVRQQAAGAAARFRSLRNSWQQQPALTGSELYWNMITEALAGRPLTVLDPRAGGRRHLLLASPEEIGAGRLLQQNAGSHEPSLDGTAFGPGGTDFSPPPQFSSPAAAGKPEIEP
ncbi:MAG: cation-translocating P-type ATPase family protein [Planctomycetaceae bacterium]|nr:cation-translocating P-type ATPase family protein [Planctomycetaceae bacterium]